MRKSVRIGIWAALAVVICALTGGAGAEARRSGVFMYEVMENQTARIVDYSDPSAGESTELVIPAELDGIPVTAIGESAFNQKSGLTGVTVPEGVVSIGNKAFSACDAIASVSLPSTLESIGSRAFSSCKSLRSIALPSALKELGDNPFAMCDNLTEVKLDADHPVFAVENGCLLNRQDGRLIAFLHQTENGTYTVAPEIRVIGRSAFAYSGELERVIFPEGLEVIEDSAFARCAALRGVVFPASLTTLGNKAFAD